MNYPPEASQEFIIDCIVDDIMCQEQQLQELDLGLDLIWIFNATRFAVNCSCLNTDMQCVGCNPYTC